MGLGPGSGFAGFFPGVNQGLKDVQDYDQRSIENQREKQRLQQEQLQAQGINNEYSANANATDGKTPQIQVGDPVISKIFGKLKGYFGNGAQAPDGKNPAVNGPTAGQSLPPAAQSTVPGQSNAAQSPPGPSSSNSAAGGIPGSSGSPSRLNANTQPITDVGIVPGGSSMANGGAIPGRKGIRPKKPKPGNIAKPTKAAQQAMHPPMEKPPVDAVSMGAEGGQQDAVSPPRNTDAQPGSQDPMLANGGFLASTGAKGKIPPDQDMEPKADPNSLDRGIKQDGQRSRFARTIKKFDDGGSTDPSPDPDSPEYMKKAAAQNRAAKPATISGTQDATQVDPTEPAVGMETAQTVGEAKMGLPARAMRGAKNLGKKAGTAGAALTLGAAADQSVNTSDEAYARRFGMPDAPTADGSVGNFAKNLGIRAAGYASDVGNDVTFGGLRAVHDKMYPDSPWNSDEGRKAAPPGQQQDPGIDPVNVTAQHVPTPAPAAPGGAPHGAAPAPAAPPGQPAIDFSQVDVDHTQIPNTSADDWDRLKHSSMMNMIAHGTPAVQAKIAVDDQVSDYQHRQFLQMMQQGIALDRAGNKKGAMAALKTAYQYMPTGHDVSFGIDRTTGNIVGYGVDEQSGKPVGQPVMLDQKNLNGLLATYQDPKAFVNESLAMRKQTMEENHVNKGQIPLERAQGVEARQRGNYFEGLNDTRLDIASMRAASAGQSRLPVQSQKFYASQINPSIVDPREQGEALGVAEQLEHRYGNSPQSQGKIAGVVKQLYSMPPEQRAAFAQQYQIALPGMQQSDGGYGAQGQGYGGYGMPPR